MAVTWWARGVPRVMGDAGRRESWRSAGRTSLRLLRPGDAEISPVAFTNLVLRVWQSLVAGIDVARRALDPGVVVFSPRLPGGRSEGFLHAELCTSCTSNWRRQTTAPRR